MGVVSLRENLVGNVWVKVLVRFGENSVEGE